MSIVTRPNQTLLGSSGLLFVIGESGQDTGYFLGPMAEGCRRLWRFERGSLPKGYIATTAIGQPSDDQLPGIVANAQQ
jgi:hypothetical protein